MVVRILDICNLFSQALAFQLFSCITTCAACLGYYRLKNGNAYRISNHMSGYLLVYTNNMQSTCDDTIDITITHAIYIYAHTCE